MLKGRPEAKCTVSLRLYARDGFVAAQLLRHLLEGSHELFHQSIIMNLIMCLL